MENKTRKCIKGFNSNLKCLGFQYEVGKSYELPDGETPKICERGFHAIDEDENPLLVFRYYPPVDSNGQSSRYCEVEIDGVTEKEDSKIVGSRIKIVREIGVEGVVEAHKEWEKRHGNGNISSIKDDDCSVASNTGYHSVASNTGLGSVASNAGYHSIASNAGSGSVVFNTGDRSVASNTGGWCSLASNTGYCSVAVSNGRYSSALTKGKDSVALAAGFNDSVKGSLGCVIVAIERGSNEKIISVASSIVDGVNIKDDVWYKCVDGKLVEC